MKDDRFRPDAAARRVMPTGIAGNRGDRLIVDDPHATREGKTACPICGKPASHEHTQDEIDAVREHARRFFEPTKPIAGVGRNSIPKSHRGEGLNYVD
jgi:hypothetical protein